MRTLITLATYNERETLPALVDEIWRAAPDAQILVIDDNSPDGTGAWCAERARDEPRLACIHRSGKLGLGSATIAGLRYAIEHDYDLVVNMDADFSHHPRHLPSLVAGMESPDGSRIDCMIGSRYVSGGRIEGWPRRRLWMSRAVNWYARLLLGLTSRDCSGAYRCYRTAILRQIDFDQILSRGYSFQEEILWQIKQRGGRIAETPITFSNRIQGYSKINMREALEAVRVIFILGMKNLVARPAPGEPG